VTDLVAPAGAGPALAPAERRAHAVFHRLRVREIDRLTDDAVAVTFDVPAELADAYEFTQGQHLTVRGGPAGDEDRRNYSICAPAGSGRLRIAVKRLPGGAFSTYAAESLRIGDELEVMTPTGRFFTALDPANAKHYVAVAAGSGITPILSLLTTTLETEPHSRFTLLYGNRTVRTIMFLEELEDLKNRYRDRFHLVHVLSREARDVELFSGRLDRAKLETIFELLLPIETVDEWFLCGPYEMVDGARQLLLERGVHRRYVHTELFFVGDVPPPPPPEDVAGAAVGASSVTIVLDGRRTTFDLPQHGTSVLDGVLRERTDAPFACKGGVCGTCRARLVEGEVAMDQNWALEDEELARGYVLTCQSHPRTDKVVLDYDA
jgi:ring-1,2-phenylacetyl-CoA epoxidase subunit PaaE